MHQSIVAASHPGRAALPANAPEGAAPETKTVPGRKRVRAARPLACPAVLSLPPRNTCRIVRQIVLEAVGLASEPPVHRRDSRRHICHVRQIAMYVCHVVLQLSLSDIGAAFGRDRTTAGHACNVVEDRRDDAAFDDFVATIERLVVAVFGPAGFGGHD